MGIPKQRAHASVGCIGEERENYISAEKIYGIGRSVGHFLAENIGEYQAHNEQGKQRRKHAPEHSEIGSFVFLLEVTLNKLREQKAMLLEPPYVTFDSVCHFYTPIGFYYVYKRRFKNERILEPFGKRRSPAA